jgi:hypothetical protein
MDLGRSQRRDRPVRGQFDRCLVRQLGQERYPQAEVLTVTAEAGGSNSPRGRLWRVELQRLADLIGVPIRLLHYPPGTSKWNRIEHRLFSYISTRRPQAAPPRSNYLRGRGGDGACWLSGNPVHQDDPFDLKRACKIGDVGVHVPPHIAGRERMVT